MVLEIIIIMISILLVQIENIKIYLIHEIYSLITSRLSNELKLSPLYLVICPKKQSRQITGNFKLPVDLLVTGHLFMRTVFAIKSVEDLKSKYKTGSDYNLGQTLSRLDFQNLHQINLKILSLV